MPVSADGKYTLLPSIYLLRLGVRPPLRPWVGSLQQAWPAALPKDPLVEPVTPLVPTHPHSLCNSALPGESCIRTWGSNQHLCVPHLQQEHPGALVSPPVIQS